MISNFHALIPRVCLPLTQDIEKYAKITGSVTKKKNKLFVIGSLSLIRMTIPAIKNTNENTRKRSYDIEPIRLKSDTLDFIVKRANIWFLIILFIDYFGSNFSIMKLSNNKIF